MNAPALFEYGIHTEQSDIRAHVSVVHRSLYVFQTHRAVTQIQRKADSSEPYPIRGAGQPGIDGLTATGWCVPPGDIPGLRVIQWPFRGWDGFAGNLSTSDKGKRAVDIVVDVMSRGYFPLWVNASEDERREVQIQGVDIVVNCNARVQVKCDYKSGPRPLGYGNLFLQRSERNPLRLI